jgi:hypothetical protein
MNFKQCYMLRRYLKRRKLKRKLAKLQLIEKVLLYNVLYGEWEKTNPFFLSEHSRVTKEIESVTKQISCI